MSPSSRCSTSFFSFCVKELEGSNYKTVTLPVVLYGSKNSSRILWDEIRLRVFENGLLRNTYGLKTQEARKTCKKLHNWESHNLNSSPFIVRANKVN